MKNKSEENRRFQQAFLGKSSDASTMRGEEAEQLFHRMVEQLIHNKSIHWLVGISRASAEQDLTEKTDFLIKVRVINKSWTDEYEMRVNIKSSHDGVQRFRKANMGSRVHAMLVNEKTTPHHLKRALKSAFYMDMQRRRRSK